MVGTYDLQKSLRRSRARGVRQHIHVLGVCLLFDCRVRTVFENGKRGNEMRKNEKDNNKNTNNVKKPRKRET